MKTGRIGTMSRYTIWSWLALVLLAVGAAAQTQTNVTTPTPGGTTNAVPYFSGPYTLGSSPITVSGSNVGIGTNTPFYSLDIQESASGIGTNALQVGQTDTATSIPHVSKFATQQQGSGSGRTVLYAACNTTSTNCGQFDIVTETGRNFISHFLYTDGTGAIAYIYGASSATLALNGNGSSYFNGGNVGIGTTNPGAKLEINGNLRFTGDPSGTVQTTAWTGVLCGGDYAEAVNAKGLLKSYGPGDVLVIGDGTEGEVQKSSTPYSTMVAGILATKPGVIGRRQSLLKDASEIPMAMVGIVPTKVSAENGPIHRGDLLVTSSTTGYAMKGTDRSRLVGAVIGKAMGPLEAGTGVIEVLVTLQ